jgi:hypothetical protein
LLSPVALKKIAAEARSWRVVAQALRYKFGADFSSDFTMGTTLAVAGDLQPISGPQLQDRDMVKITGGSRVAPNSDEWEIRGVVQQATDPAAEGQEVTFSVEQFNSPSLEVPPAEEARAQRPERPPRRGPQTPLPSESDVRMRAPDMPGEVATPAEEMGEDLAPGASGLPSPAPRPHSPVIVGPHPQPLPRGSDVTYVAPGPPGSEDVSPYSQTSISERPAPARPQEELSEPPPGVETTKVDRGPKKG